MPMPRFIVWSNGFYLIPVAVSLYFHAWIPAVAITVLAVISTIFHVRRGTVLLKLDDWSAHAVGALCAVFLYIGRFSPWFWLAFFVLIGGLIIRYLLDTRYRHPLYHGAWHLCASLAMASCVLAYASVSP